MHPAVSCGGASGGEVADIRWMVPPVAAFVLLPEGGEERWKLVGWVVAGADEGMGDAADSASG